MLSIMNSQVAIELQVCWLSVGWKYAYLLFSLVKKTNKSLNHEVDRCIYTWYIDTLALSYKYNITQQVLRSFKSEQHFNPFEYYM